MSNKKSESVQERLARIQRDTKEAKESSNETANLVSQLTHESDGEPDFDEIAKKLQARKEEVQDETKSNIKMTIYIEEPVAKSFMALCVKRGDQRRFATEAFKDFVRKKTKELDL